MAHTDPFECRRSIGGAPLERRIQSHACLSRENRHPVREIARFRQPMSRPFECRVDGVRVVVADVRPTTTLGDAVRACVSKLGRRDAIALAGTEDDGRDDGRAATHAAYVDGRDHTRELGTAVRLLNLGVGARIEVRAIGSGRVGREGGNGRGTASSGGRGGGGDATADARASTGADAVERDFRVIRRATEIEEGPEAPTEEEPDGFFELTTLDARGLVGRAKAEPILMTKKMREAAEAGKARPARAVIRFMAPMPSDLIVEASFSASERVRDLYAFVERCASSADVASKIELFVTPPKRVLARNDEATLLSAGLAPASRVRVGVKGSSGLFASASEAEALFRADVVALVAEQRPTVRVVEKKASEETTSKAPADARTAEEKKKALADKLARGGKPSWLKL